LSGLRLFCGGIAPDQKSRTELPPDPGAIDEHMGNINLNGELEERLRFETVKADL
jgi:hypothetical protein